MSTQPDTTTPYLHLPTLLTPTFAPQTHANSLLLSTNNPTDTPLDLSTPLSRALFDLQEVDTHIDTLTTSHALPVITHTRERSEASTRILEDVEERVRSLGESYTRLEREVVERHAAAEHVRVAAGRMLATLRVGREVGRYVGLGRQLEGFVEEGKREGGGRGMVGAARCVLGLREVLAGADGAMLGRVRTVVQVRQEIVIPAERTLLSRAQGVVREFSMSSLAAPSSASGNPSDHATQTFAQTEDTKTRTTSALQTLYLLSPTTDPSSFNPTLLLTALQTYLQTALTASLASLTRALATLPTLDRTLLEISARCQNIVALENLLASTAPPQHPSFPPAEDEQQSTNNLLLPLLRHLDTSSLPSYFWRSMAGQLSARVQEILSRGGVSARTLRTNRERVRDAIRECVDRGSRLPVSSLSAGATKGGEEGVKNWEREAAVMVGAVVGPLR